MLSNTSKYAIRALIYLELYSSADKKVGIREIAGELDIPYPFLGKILQILVKHKFLGSTKGPHGGFYLEKPAMDIPLMELIEIIEGKDIFNNCVVRTTDCDPKNPCSIHHKVAPTRWEMRRILSTETIADLVSEFREGKKGISI
jgi:Rrf2 family protein